MKEKIFIISLFYLLIFIQSNYVPNENEAIIMNMYYKNKDNYTIKNSSTIDLNATAYAIYNKSYERIGWDFLAIGSYEKIDSKYKDEDKAYAMGYLEGVLTKDRIYSFFINMKHFLFHKNQFKIPDNIKEFLKRNIEYMKEMSSKKKDVDIYWENVYYIYKQFQGLYDGYMSVAENGKKIEYDDFLLIPSFIDSNEVKYYNNSEDRPNFQKMTSMEIKKFTLLHSHCSALIKLAEDYSDIWFGHNTWFYYNSMIRIFKEYKFISNKKNLKSKIVAFSSYPGTLFSVDDFYYLDSNLLVMETTNSIFMKSFYNLIKPESLLTWVRVIVSNRLASSAEEWTDIFKKENSGTYNNQYMILDLNKIDLKNKKIPEKSLMIIEQIPGETEINDVTEVLKKGYWPSYNIPYSERIYNITGYNLILDLYKELVPNLDYNNCSRARIFRRDQNKIKSNEDFKNMMRYNDYENDEESMNDPSLAIACRGDLAKNESHCFGATDVKFVSVKELLEGKNNIHIISSPTNIKQPTFSWKNATCYEQFPDFFYHEGIVDTWNFPWVDYRLQLLNITKEDKKKDKENSNKLIIIICLVAGGIIILALILIIILVKNKKSYQELGGNIKTTSFKDDRLVEE